MNEFPPDIEFLIKDLALYIHDRAPEHLPLFHVCAQEAIFARRWLDSSISSLKSGAAILEVGAGLLILSCQLKREGYSVVALEPLGLGFSNFSALQRLVLTYAEDRNIRPELIVFPIEQMNLKQRFDFVFSVNVMEHIGDIDKGIRAIHQSLRPGAKYRFICPNYLFPYEPHFNLPTFFSKALTRRILGKQISGSSRVSEPVALWDSLNWINVLQIKKMVHALPNTGLNFNNEVMSESLVRMTTDSEFAGRRPLWLRKIIRSLLFFKLHKMTKFLPAELLPIIDCTITSKLKT